MFESLPIWALLIIAGVVLALVSWFAIPLLVGLIEGLFHRRGK